MASNWFSDVEHIIAKFEFSIHSSSSSSFYSDGLIIDTVGYLKFKLLATFCVIFSFKHAHFDDLNWFSKNGICLLRDYNHTIALYILSAS